MLEKKSKGRGQQSGESWWDYLPPTNVALVQNPSLMPYVGRVCCWFSALLWEVFLQVLWFSPSSKTNISRFQFDYIDEEPPCGCTFFKIIIYFISLACFSSETLKMQASVFFHVCMLKGAHGPKHSWQRPWRLGIRIVAWQVPCMFWEDSLEEINSKDIELFWNGSTHKFYHWLLWSKRTLQRSKRRIVEHDIKSIYPKEY